MLVAPRPEVLRIDPYVGGESKLAGVNRTVKLSSNEGAFGAPPAARAAYAAASSGFACNAASVVVSIAWAVASWV